MFCTIKHVCTHTHKYIYLHTYIHSNSINIDFQVSARVLRVAGSQPCYRIKIILVKEEYTHSLYSVDYASTARRVLSFFVFFSCHVTKGVTRAIYRISQRRQRGSARVSGCQSLRMCTNDMGKTPFLSGSPSMCPIWKQKMTYVRGKHGDAVWPFRFHPDAPWSRNREDSPTTPGPLLL